MNPIPVRLPGRPPTKAAKRQLVLKLAAETVEPSGKPKYSIRDIAKLAHVGYNTARQIIADAIAKQQEGPA